MSVSKVILNGQILIDVTLDTVASSNLLSGYQATGADGGKVQGAFDPQGGIDGDNLAYGSVTSHYVNVGTADNMVI